MCGIVGVLGKEDVAPRLLEGLRRLEYRGYDSAGIAISSTRDGEAAPVEVRRAVGKLESLEVFRKTFEDWEILQEGVEVTIPERSVETWLGFLNDTRLYLGVELDITENDWSAGLDPDEEISEELALLHLLTWLQQCVLDALGFIQERYMPEDEETVGDEPGEG